MRSTFSTAALWLCIGAFSFFGAGTGAPAAHATTLMRMSLGQLARTAREIVRARCMANMTGWQHGEIWTFTTFDVQENWHGATGERITVKLLGGRTERITSLVSGVPRFRPAEEVILFIEPDGGYFSVTSWEQGVFRVSRDASSGSEDVTQDSAYFETFDPATRRFAASGIRRMDVSAFRSEIEAALANAPEGRR